MFWRLPYLLIIMIWLILIIYLIEPIKSITLDDDVGRSIHQSTDDEIVQISHHPYPESADFYAHVVPEIAKAKNRSKRAITIAYPRLALCIFDFYLNILLRSPGYVYAPLTLEARYFLAIPNITLFSAGRSLEDRLNLFQTFEKAIQGFGLDGQTCVLRAICEREEYHVMTDGILGEIISLALSLGSSYEGLDSQLYEDASKHGRQSGDCDRVYSECPFSVFGWLDGDF